MKDEPGESAQLPELPVLPTISASLWFHAERTPESTLARLGDQRISYACAAERVAALSRALLASGVVRGDRIATLSTPRPEALLLFLACADIGAIWLGLNPKSTGDELDYVVGKARPRVLFSIAEFRDTQFARKLTDFEASGMIEATVTLDGAGGGEFKPLSEFESWGASLSDTSRLEARAEVQGDMPALLVYTSGTTGHPKGALLTHKGLAWTYRRQWQRWRVHPFRTICNMPINHLAGIGEACLSPLVGAGEVVFMESFDPAGILELLCAGRINVMIQIPSMYQLLLSHSSSAAEALAKLDLLVWAGGALPRAAIEELRRQGVRCEGMYGSTESTIAVCYVDTDATLDQLSTTIGRVDPEVSVRLVDDSGPSTSDTQQGEIQVRHHACFAGYLDDPEATADAFTSDGYLRMGDVAIRGEDGYLRLVGRLKEMFKSGGHNVYPREIELCVEGHPDVELCAVVSVSDPPLGRGWVRVRRSTPKRASESG